MADDHITPQMLGEIADRIEEASYTLRRMPDRERALLAKGERGQGWPLMLRTRMEHGAWDGVKVQLPPPDAAHITRMHEVMDWLLDLAKQQADYCKVVWLLYGERRKVRDVVKIMGHHRNTITAWRNAGLCRIAQYRRTAERARAHQTWRPKKNSHIPA